MSLYLVLDQGTSSTKSFLFTDDGEAVHSNRVKHPISRPKLHHAESDPLEIAEACASLISEAISYANSKSDKIKCMGMAVQRSTFLFWDKKNLKPLTPAISWQDSRAKDIEEELQSSKSIIFEKTGQPLSGHFGGPKFLHFLRNDPDIRSVIKNETAWFGPISSYLTHSLTGTCAVDESIACRSIMMNLSSQTWDAELCSLFSSSQSALPDIRPTVHDFGTVYINDDSIPLKCVIGDQQAALIGQSGWQSESMAINLGTSGSLQINAGTVPIMTAGLLSSVLYSIQDKRQFILEGTVNACNALFYGLEEELGIAHKEMVWEERCANTVSEGIFFPGSMGIAAPYWNSGEANTLHAFPRKPGHNEIIRAGMESIAFLIHDIFSVANEVKPMKPKMVSTSGGGARAPLLQFLADLLQIPVGLSSMKDKTAVGVFNLLKKADDKDWLPQQFKWDTIYRPQMSSKARSAKLTQWNQALQAEGIKPVSVI